MKYTTSILTALVVVLAGSNLYSLFKNSPVDKRRGVEVSRESTPIRKQMLEVYQAKEGTSAEEPRKALKAGESAIGEDYLAYMRQAGVIGDSSFVVELDGKVFLLSYYLFGPSPDEKPKMEISGMQAYQETLKPFFDDSELIRRGPANSFWADVNLKGGIGESTSL